MEATAFLGNLTTASVRLDMLEQTAASRAHVVPQALSAAGLENVMMAGMEMVPAPALKVFMARIAVTSVLELTPCWGRAVDMAHAT